MTIPSVAKGLPIRALASAMAQFTLSFDPSQILKLAKRYNFQDDGRAISAGARIRAGHYTRPNLMEIFEWKTKGRGRSRLLKNSDQEIADALMLAIAAKADRSALAVLTGLNGIEIPVASAILTAIDPERFTIIDFRALEALGIRTANITIPFYLAYLTECRKIARQNKVSLRTLDRALWQWSKENSEKV